MRMEDDQQFCLRWNNHQSTLVAVFDTLLENGTLVDCTLAAEGKYLNAHKVVLSACSPYFEALLSQNYDKHPIFILKDVKYQELKAMMDYMYRGEVNISQDQLGALLKAAESLQIKGLSDNRKGETETRKSAPPPPPPAKSPPPASSSLPRVQGLTIEQRRRELEESREGSQSPGARKKKRIRRRSLDDLDNHHDASNSSESHHSSQAPAQNIPATIPAASSKLTADVPEPIETKSEILTRHKTSNESEVVPQVPIKEKIETHSELMLEPKAEYIEEMNEDSIEDLTLDDDDLSNMEQMDDQGAGPSHGNMGEGSGQGFGGWHMGNQSQDEVFLAAQEAVGAHRDSQDTTVEEGPQIRIMKVETLQGSHAKVSKRIEKEVRRKAVTFEGGKVALVKFPKFKLVIQKSDPKSVKTESTSSEKKSDEPTSPVARKSPVRSVNYISKERMKRFLRMTPADLPRPVRKTYACERDIKLLKTPKDTIRCTACGVLYERVKRNEHLKECKKTVSEQHKYACASCNFKHADIKEIEVHVETTHRKKGVISGGT